MATALEPLDLTRLGGRLLTRREAAFVLGVSPKTMSNWAHTGHGTRVIWLSEGVPRYALDEINECTQPLLPP